MQTPNVFVIAPFDAEGRRVHEVVRRAVQEVGLRSAIVEYGDTTRPGAQFTRTVLDAIHEADLIIADVNHQNPNVLVELGYALALRKPIILLVNLKSGSSLPSDLTGLQYIAYDDLDRLADMVKKETKALALRWSA